MPVRRLLELVRHTQHFRLGEIIADNMQPDRQSAVAKAARDGHRRQAGQVGGNGVNIVQIHLHRIGGFGADLEGDRR